MNIIATGLSHPATPPAAFRRRIAGLLAAAAMGACQALANPVSASPAGEATLPPLRGGTTVTAGSYHTCATLAGGTLRCWGYGLTGQLGHGDLATYPFAVAVAGMHGGVQSVGVGGSHTCAVKGGAALCWGENDAGQLGDGSHDNRAVPGPVQGLGQGVAQVTASWSNSCALTTTGAVKCWGRNDHGQLGDGTQVDRDVPGDVVGLDGGVIGLATGGTHSCALKDDRSVVCWGRNQKGQLGDGSTTSRTTPVAVQGLDGPVETVSAGLQHTCVLMQDGGIRCWGGNGDGQLGDGTTTDRLLPVQVTGLPGPAVALSAGDFHTCALIEGGDVWCWGFGEYGQLGNDTLDSSPFPVAVQDIGGPAIVLSAGYAYTCVVRADGGLRCWGDNVSGQLGNDTIQTEEPLPVTVLQADGIFDSTFE